MNVTSQQEARKIRNTISFCYLCGNALSRPITAEHIVPKSVLSPVNDSQDIWSPILNVHEQCDQEGKRFEDFLIRTLLGIPNGLSEKTSDIIGNLDSVLKNETVTHALRENPEILATFAANLFQEEQDLNLKEFLQGIKDRISDSNLISSIDSALKDIQPSSSDYIETILKKGHFKNLNLQETTYNNEKAFSGLRTIEKGMTKWFQGLYSFLYGLPIAVDEISIHFPVKSATTDISLEEFDRIKARIYLQIVCGQKNSSIDSIHCRAFGLSFFIAWLQGTDESPWIAAASLSLPLLEEFSKLQYPEGLPVLGMIRQNRKPQNASFLSESQFLSFLESTGLFLKE